MLYFVSDYPVDGADAGHTFVVAYALQEQPVSDLPGKKRGVGVFQMQNHLNHFGCGNLGLGSTNYPWPDASCLIVPGQDFAHAAVTDAHASGDLARTHSLSCKLHNALPERVRQWASVYEDSSELVHAAVTCTGTVQRQVPYGNYSSQNHRKIKQN